MPFVHATVVRAQGPSSAKAGDQAIVLADGSIEGFVGGQCASGSVRTAALDLLESGESLLLRVLPEGEPDFPSSDGARIVVNPCLSGGALEIFLEPLLPSPMLTLIGGTPTANAVADLAHTLGFAVTQTHEATPAGLPDGTIAVIVASHGGDELGVIQSAIQADIPFIGMVASRRRAAGVLAPLPPQNRARVHSPVGFDIGARTPPEIALSIMADLVQRIRRDGLTAEPSAAMVAPIQVVDPVCGMTVVVGPDTPHTVVDGTDFWFCATGCRDTYLAEHADAGA
ncbi:carbon monoxide dehydrogenase accessory protein [Leekyejoonella antrihumi]|uniref:Carbon monoxide dehydrogenase accessory protein n=2 Tax=Leekyejoonella antrihumi TaxID=1660198 RepID=A0A563DUW6_9MICO|nr:carbon monoxide dehydrogenase accessory protein [Leekyejoonella antrihumi]